MTTRLFDTIEMFSAGVYLTIPLIPLDTPCHASSCNKSGRLTVSYDPEATWGTCVCAIQTSGPVCFVAYSPHGPEIVSADYDNVCLWDSQTSGVFEALTTAWRRNETKFRIAISHYLPTSTSHVLAIETSPSSRAFCKNHTAPRYTS